jgi:hypothetical protein
MNSTREIPGTSNWQHAVDVLVVDGLMSTHPRMKFADVRLWLECSPDTHRELRLERDCSDERHYTEESARRNWKLHEREWARFAARFDLNIDYRLNVNKFRLLRLSTAIEE